MLSLKLANQFNSLFFYGLPNLIVRCVLSIFCLAVLLFPPNAVAGDFEDGLVAYNSKDFSLAFRKFKASSESGVASALNNLGVLYATGSGVNRSAQEAFGLFQRAAKRGEAYANANLIVLSRSSKDVRAKLSYADLAKFSAASERAGITIGSDYLISPAASSIATKSLAGVSEKKDPRPQFDFGVFLSRLVELTKQHKVSEACQLFNDNDSELKKI